MLRYPAGDGWGPDGLEVDDGGRVYKFTRPVCKVLLKVGSGEGTVYFGINEVITNPTEENEVIGGTINEGQRVASITAEEALAKGVPVGESESVVIDCPIDSTHGRRGIWCIWLITDTGESSTVTGGVVGM